MKVKFKLAWQNYRVGDVIEPPAMLRNWLLNNKYCVPEGLQTREEKPMLTLKKVGRPANKVM